MKTHIGLVCPRDKNYARYYAVGSGMSFYTFDLDSLGGFMANNHGIRYKDNISYEIPQDNETRQRIAFGAMLEWDGALVTDLLDAEKSQLEKAILANLRSVPVLKRERRGLFSWMRR